MKHNFHSDLVAKAHEEYRGGMLQSIYSRPVTDAAKAEKILNGLAAGLQNPKAPEFIEAAKALDECLNSANDFRDGRYSEVIMKSFGIDAEGRKAVTNSVMPMMPRTVVEFRNMFNENDIDDYWQFIYQIDNATDVFSISLVSVINLVVFHQLKSANDKIPFGQFMASNWENLSGEFFGGGIAVGLQILLKDPLTSVNSIIVAIRIAAEVKKTAVATTNINAGIVAADAAGFTTSFTGSSVAATINAGRYTLAERSKGNGYNIGRQTPMVLVANESIEELIETNFRETNNVAFGTLRVNRPITRVYTNNLSVSLGISGVKAVLWLPFRENRVGMFSNLAIESWLDPETNSRKVGGRESYNFLTNAAQAQILNLS